MSLENASGGFTDLEELARNKTLVVCRIKEFHAEEKDAQRGYVSNPVTVDLLLCSGERAGEVVRGMKIKKNGVTNTLRRSAPGKDVAGVIQPKVTDKRPDGFVSLDPADSAQLEAIKKVYRDGVGFDSNDNLVAATASAPATGGGATAANDEPPF